MNAPRRSSRAWEAEGDSRGLDRMTAAFWDAGTSWMFEQLGDSASSRSNVRCPNAALS